MMMMLGSLSGLSDHTEFTKGQSLVSATRDNSHTDLRSMHAYRMEEIDTACSRYRQEALRYGKLSSNVNGRHERPYMSLVFFAV
jgi:hypothetical protein